MEGAVSGVLYQEKVLSVFVRVFTWCGVCIPAFSSYWDNYRHFPKTASIIAMEFSTQAEQPPVPSQPLTTRLCPVWGCV
uniref:Uncharacterized protein n=1 Tax=Anguilla anguilla TaxID=7936 RepID=A0A0E9RQ50_ANGAN